MCMCLSYNYDKKGDVCFGPEQKDYRFFGTKTDYAVIADLAKDESSTPLDIPAGCEPKLFFSFQRHSISFPNGKMINASLEYLPKIQEKITKKMAKKKLKMCEKDLKAILAWKNGYTMEFENDITESGRRVVREQVRRLKKRFPAVFTKDRKYPDNIIVDFTDKGGRTKDTAEPYLREWFGDYVFENEINQSLTEVNELNTFHETCEAIMTKNGIAIDADAPEMDTFMDSEIWDKLKETISKRLDDDFGKKKIKAMYEQCRFGLAINDSSPWCAVFSDEELKVMDIRDDIDDYYDDGYGQDRNKMMACPLAIDVMQHIRSVDNSSSKFPKAVLHFSHAGAFKKVVTLFRIAEETKKECSDRSWQSAKLAPFNANLNIVYYQCPKEEKVALLFNERLRKLPFCQDKFCTIEEFSKYMDQKIGNCDLEQICK